MSVVTEATYIEAVCQAQAAAMAEDDSIVLLGQDIATGFPFGATKGLFERFGPERVRNTPISEGATMGCGAGAAMMGVRTVIEVDFSGFLYLGFDQLLNNVAKLRYMSNGQIRLPLLIRFGVGPLGSFAAQHSQSPQGWLANTPGLCVCVPATVQDAHDLTRWALRQDDPVVIAEDLRLYRTRGALDMKSDGWRPGAVVARQGCDATAVTYGFGTGLALEAAETLADEGIELEVLNLRSLSPLDEIAIGTSVRQTGRAVCVSDDPVLGGFAATLAAVVSEEAYGHLKAPVLRLGSRHVPSPYASVLEKQVYPSPDSLIDGVRQLVDWPEGD